MQAFRDLVAQLERSRKRMRVYEYLIEQLQPFLDHDIGQSETLIAEGCFVPTVEKEIIRDVIDELVDKLGGLDAEAGAIQDATVSTPRKNKAKRNKPAAKPAPKPVATKATTDAKPIRRAR